MPPACNKCRQGIAQEGDSWCLGCSSLELSQGLLKQVWRHPSLRAIAEESALSAARLIRAFANVDQSLPQPSAATSERAPALSSKARAVRPARSRTPRRDDRPPLQRSPKRTKAEVRSEPESEDYEFEEDEEEEDNKPETEVVRERRGSERPPEPEGPPPDRKEPSRAAPATEHRRSTAPDKRPRRKRTDHHSGRRRRGGARHQKRYKDLQNPFRRSHRKLRGDILEFAQSLEEGLTRRY